MMIKDSAITTVWIIPVYIRIMKVKYWLVGIGGLVEEDDIDLIYWQFRKQLPYKEQNLE